MAKSLRSKWRRKMKAIKRERYGVKELEKLKSIVNAANAKEGNDVQMSDLQDLVTVVSPPSKQLVSPDDVEKMEDDSKIKIFNPATMRDQYGNYPVWMSSHRKKKILKREKKYSKIKRKADKKTQKKKC